MTETVDLATIRQAAERVVADFPFSDYFDPVEKGHISVAATLTRFIAPGASILDFGAGPLDKTAVFSQLGYKCTAMDDLGDEWHARGDARDAILRFAERENIDYLVLDGSGIPPTGEFDVVMLHDVLEHLHDSPRDLLIELLSRVRDGGLLFVTVPNHLNLRKRIAAVRGHTIHPRFDTYYWYPGVWRGHVREYTSDDCARLAAALGLEVLEIAGVHHMLEKVPPRFRRAYLGFSRLFPSTRDTWSMVARKPAGWTPRRELSDADLRKVTGLTSWGELGH